MATPAASKPAPEGTPRLTTLGAARLAAPAGEELLGPGKPLALLTYLAAAPRRSASREHLVDLLWSDLEPERARHALRQTIWFLRQLLGTEALVTRGPSLDLAADVQLDRDAFLRAVESGELLEAARLYQGDFLAGFAAPGGVEFEHWADVERQRLRSTFLRVAESLVRPWLNEGKFREAQPLARRARDADPSSESAWRLLFETLIQGGDRLALTLEVDEFEKRLAALGRPPEPATRMLFTRAQVAVQPAIVKDSAPGLVAELVGREREFSAVIARWQQPAAAGRHVHLSGAAGLGKTRLLSDIATRLRTLGGRVVALRANPGQREIGYSFVGELAARLAELPGAAAVSPATAGTLVALNPTLSGRYSQPIDSATGEEALRRRTSALTELVRTVADEQRLALLLDDLHWLDAASRQVLAGALPQLAGPGVLTVTASRPSPAADPGEGASERLELLPLTVEQVAALTASLGQLPDAPWTRSLPEALTRSTGGSPLLVLETLQLAIDRGWLRLEDGGWHCDEPEALARALEAGSAVRYRIAQLDRESRRVLLLLAVAGGPVTSDLLLQATRQEEDTLAAVLGTLEQRGFVSRHGRQWQPGHDEIAADVVAGATDPDLEATHRALGAALAEGEVRDARQLHRAAIHFRAAGAGAELIRLFDRYLRSTRALGDQRRVGEIAYELLGEGATMAEVLRLVGGIPPWTRLRFSSARRVVAAVAALAVVAAGVAGLVSWRNRPEAILVLQEANRLATDRIFEIPVSLPGWDPEEPIQAADTRPRPLPLQQDGVDGFAPGNRPDQYLVTRQVEGSVQDIYLLEGSDTTRLVASPTDDVMPVMSPDGRYIVYATGAYSPRDSAGNYDPRTYSYDLALLDRRRGTTRHLTSGLTADQSPAFSPDGTRIAFQRFEDGRYSACWMSLEEGATPSCRTLPGSEVRSMLGWRDDQTLLLITWRHSIFSVTDLQLSSGTERLVIGDVISARLSPDRRWLAFTAARDGVTREELYIAPIDAPGTARRVELGPGRAPSEFLQWWRRLRPPRSYIEQFEIVHLPNRIALDAARALRFVARSQASPEGTQVHTPVRWSVSDTSVARVDASGNLIPLRQGEVTVIGRLGLLEDSAAVRIVADSNGARLSEDWSRPLETRWKGLGYPLPTLVTTVEGRRALSANGDGSHVSGAYSRRKFDWSDGVGIEGQLSVTITRDKWQNAGLALVVGLDSAALGDWDHVTGQLPYRMASFHLLSCQAAYPGREGAGRDTTVSVGGGGSVDQVAVPPSFGQGRWFRLRVQLFPDGRCGVAVNGVPMWRSRLSVRGTEPAAAFIYGANSQTTALHGPVEVWQGIRDDVPWARLDDPAYDPQLALARTVE